MKDFLKYTFASLVGSLLGLALVVGLGVGGLITLIIAAASQETGPKVEDKSVLVFDLSLNVTDSQPDLTSSEILEKTLSETLPSTLTLKSVLDTLEKAATDPKIVALYLQGSGTPGEMGWANLKEVRQALQKFRDGGKPILAYDMDWTEREYYLSSIANQVFINPSGYMEFNGLSIEPLFLAGALEKFGVGVQVTRVGKYKSAVEPFILKQMSPENRQQIQKLLGDLWGEYLQSVGSHRKLSPQQLQEIANNQGIVVSEDAVKTKLVDKAAYFDEVVTELKKLTGEDAAEKSFRQIDLSTYTEIDKNATVRKAAKSKNRIAVVYAQGEIVDGMGESEQIGGDTLAEELRKIRLDEDVKAVVLRVNSPGGSATASEVIGREVKLTSQTKPVIVSMGNYAASGGYWISMHGTQIFAEPTTITGSIGVFGLLLNLQKLANNNGITWDSVKTGNYADLNTVSRPKTPQELQRIQTLVDLIYERFLTHVAESRKLPKLKVEEIAQGRVWSGMDAKQLGLVDEIGGIDSAIQAAAKQAKLEKWTLEEYPKYRTLEEQILDKLSGSDTSRKTKSLDPITSQLQALKEEFKSFTSLNDPLGVYTRLPFNLRVD